jgi:hypothetical protein
MKKNIYYIIGLLLIFSLFGCEDLEVENVNQPKFEETNTPAQTNGLVGSLLNGWHYSGHRADAPGLALFMTADVGTCSWGNFGMRDLSSEPRVAFNNNPAYPNMVPFEDYYKNMYSYASSATDALLAIQNDVNNEIEEVERAKAVSYFVQAATLGSIGMLYDKGFVVTEHTDLTQEVPMVSYDVIIDSAVAIMDKAIAICEENSFTIPQSWLPTLMTYTNVEFGQLANTMAARLLVYKSRNAAQNEANDWAKIRDYAEKGIDFDYEPIMNDNTWWDYMKVYAVYTGWGRIDMRVINMMDPNMYPWFPASGDPDDLPNSGEATSDDNRLITDFEYIKSQDFLAERGIYHYSTYRYKRWDYYLLTWTEPVAVIRKAENDMILAEAYVRTGNLSGAAAILNDPFNSRKARGGLGDVPENEDDLLEAIYYEKTIECILTGENVEFYDMRRRDMLQEGTFKHLPIPAQQLEVMGLEFYTFGGTTGEPGVDYSTGGWEKVPGYEKSNYGY